MIDKNSNQPAAEGTFIFEPRNVIDSYPQAVLQKLARIVFRLLSTGEPYDESVFHKCEEEALKRAEMRLWRQAAHLGFRIVPAEES